MPKTVSIDEAEGNLRELLSSLADDERVTIVDEAGVPLGEVRRTVSGEGEEVEEGEDFMERWEQLAQEIDEEWDGKRSAVEQLRRDRSRLDPDVHSDSSSDDS
jgi:hypothetical protein